MAPGALAQVLREIPNVKNPNLLVGYDTADDACVFQVSEDLALVQTVDFFPPMVDDPFVFGQIAAANALSDVYAMGAKPSHAMNLLCIPTCLDLEVTAQILAGGADKAREAGCTIAGGHTIHDDIPKYGMSVTGFVHPKHMMTNSGAKPGDWLILTKEVGSGVLNTALKGGLLDPSTIDHLIDNMRTLNKVACESAQGLRVHGCTDITGFGLAGHLCEMAQGGGTTMVLHCNQVPFLPQALEMATMGIIPAGAYNNRGHFAPHITIAPQLETPVVDLVFDPQTSGGLLFSLPPEAGVHLLERLRQAGVSAALVGEVEAWRGTALMLEN